MGRPRLPPGSHGEISYRELGRRKVRAMCKVRDDDGGIRQVTREGTSRADARQRLLEAVNNRPGFHAATVSADTTVEDAMTAWLAELDRQVQLRNRAPNTARVYRSAAGEHIIPGLGGLHLREATTPRLDAFLVKMRADHGAGITKTTRTVLRGLFGWAVRQGALTSNPMREVARIEGGGPTRLPRAMTALEREQWLAAMEADEIAVWHDLPDLTRVMLGTGVRLGELLALTFADVDTDAKTLRVDWTISRVTGVGLVRGPTKSAAGARTLPLPGWVVDVLIRRGDTLGWTGPVFPAVVTREGGERRRKGGSWRDPSNTERCLREARERAGFEWVTSHSFRKTVATVLQESGMAARDAADQLGHARPSMTQDVYFGRGQVNPANAVALEEMFRPKGS